MFIVYGATADAAIVSVPPVIYKDLCTVIVPVAKLGVLALIIRFPYDIPLGMDPPAV